jgi:hypothetical protein
MFVRRDAPELVLDRVSEIIREFRGLREAMNTLSIEEGFILTNDEERELTFEGARIRILPVWKLLCAGTEPGQT